MADLLGQSKNPLIYIFQSHFGAFAADVLQVVVFLAIFSCVLANMVVATVPVGTRPYAVAADWRGAWVALLGTPVMMHTSPATSPSAGPWARLRVCGGLH